MRSFATLFCAQRMGSVRGADRASGVERRFGVLCLGCEQQDVIAASRRCSRAVDDRNAQRDGVVGRFDAKPVVANGFVVRAACDEHDVVPMLREPPADHSADGAGTEDNEAHE